MNLNRVAITAVAVAGLGVVGLGVTGCASAQRAVGMGKVTPDEFRVVSKAPLIIPPDYALRPPTPGEPTPQELQPESAARQALLGQQQAAQRSYGEQLLVTRAGADKSDPMARYGVDDQFGDLAHKDKSFADTVMFWRKDHTPQVAAVAGSTQSAPIDPAAEEARLKALTGGQEVIIKRQGKSKIKLPGL
jgi:hypothetical protein